MSLVRSASKASAGLGKSFVNRGSISKKQEGEENYEEPSVR